MSALKQQLNCVRAAALAFNRAMPEAWESKIAQRCSGIYSLTCGDILNPLQEDSLQPARHPCRRITHCARRPARRREEGRHRQGDHARPQRGDGCCRFFAQVIYTDVAKGNHFMGDAPLKADQIFVHGFIRAGRSVPDRQKLVVEMVARSPNSPAYRSATSGFTSPKSLPGRWRNTATYCPSQATNRCGWTDCQRKTARICRVWGHD